ncbi:MAG: hypothetical protein Q9163_001364 [Psora crenata]
MSGQPWKIQYENFQRQLQCVPTQGAFIPRTGEIVLFYDHESYGSLTNGFGNNPQMLSGQHVWKAGVVIELPNPDAPKIHINEISQPSPENGKYCFRIELISNLNSNTHQEGLHGRYLPLTKIRPFCFYEEILANVPGDQWDPSIFRALTVMSSFSLGIPIRLLGRWSDASILYGEISLGSETIIAGDAVRITPSLRALRATTPLILLVTSIVLTFKGLGPDPPDYTYVTGDTCTTISINMHGKLLTTEARKTHAALDSTQWRLPPALLENNHTWYHIGARDTLYTVPLARVAGRLYEAEALRRYGLPSAGDGPPTAAELAGLGCKGVLEARNYAWRNDRRIINQGDDAGRWFWANHRLEALGLDTV